MPESSRPGVVPFPSTADPSPTEGEELFEELRERLASAVGRVCPPWLVSRRDDLVQVAVLKVMDLRRRSEGNRDWPSSYLYRVALSALVDEIRRHRRRREVQLEEVSGGAEAAPADESPERFVRSREIGRGIVECLAKIIENRRLAVTLYLQGHTVPESARILGWTTKRTENLVYRGLADLRQCLLRKGLEP